MAGRNAGTADLLRFFTSRDRFPDLDAHGVAVMAALLMFVNTSGRGGTRYQCFPSHAALAAVARVTEPTVRKSIKQLESSGWLIVTKRRAGKRAASNLYDVGPAARAIVQARQAQKPKLSVILGGRHEA